MNSRHTADSGTNGDRERLKFLEADIESGMSLLRIAAAELTLGNLERASALIERARQTHSTMPNFTAEMRQQEDRQGLREKCQALDAAIHDIERQMRRREQTG